MTLDEPTNWAAAAALERGEDPRRPLIPESAAAERIAAAISPHLQPAWLTDRCIRDLSMKIVAHRGFISGVFAELDADPKRLPERDTVFQQQRVAETDSIDWWLEEAAYHKNAWQEACAHLVSQGANPADFDPDAVAQDREDARAREVSQDEAARERAPKVRAS